MVYTAHDINSSVYVCVQFMEQEGSRSLVDFWLMAENFQNHLASPAHIPDIVMDTEDAIAIYDRSMHTMYACILCIY